ncbi:MAG: TPM domain-containing protein [Eubacterium sp.]|nr:TPM domain-containing protein [Eubacterium sp.]
MKKLTVSLALFIVVLMSLPMFAHADEKQYLVDNAQLLTAEEAMQLEAVLESVSTSTGMDVVAVTTNTLDGKSPEAYADDYYDYNGYANDGCLFLISMEDRDWHISTKGYAITAITDYGVRLVENEVVPYLSQGSYYLALDKYASLVSELTAEAKKGTPYDTNHLYTDTYGITFEGEKKGETAKSIAISAIIAIVIALIVVFSVKKSYKPVQFKANAADYLVQGSLNVTQAHEQFLYSNVSKTARSDSSSGGGSSTHTSSSGSTHGGGGGKF